MVAIPSQPSWIMAVFSSPVQLVLLSTLCLLEFFGVVFCQIRTLFCFYKIFYFSLSSNASLSLLVKIRDKEANEKYFLWNQKSKLLTHIVLLFHLV
jgi:hypothetical protein